jgi:hypothetical protein
MEHIGIDLGSRESQVCIRNSAGDIVEAAMSDGPTCALVGAPRAGPRHRGDLHRSISHGRQGAAARP